jgi:hypothetical protein
MKNEGFSGGGRSKWPSYIHEKDRVIRLDRFILRAEKGFMPMPQRYCEARGEGVFAASGGTTAVCFEVVAVNGRGISRH